MHSYVQPWHNMNLYTTDVIHSFGLRNSEQYIICYSMDTLKTSSKQMERTDLFLSPLRTSAQARQP